MDTIVLICRGCDRPLRYQRPADTTVWFCERCDWSASNTSERLDRMAYGRNADSVTGDRNRFYPDQWGH